MEETISGSNESANFYTKNLVKSIVVALNCITLGYHLMIFNPLGSIIFEDVYSMSASDVKYAKGNVNFYFSIGSLCSNLVAGYLADVFGRRKLIIVYDILQLAALACYYFEHLSVLYAVRFAVGFSSAGLSAAGAMLITETLPREVSGVGNSLSYTFLATAAFLGLISPNIFGRDTIAHHWR